MMFTYIRTGKIAAFSLLILVAFAEVPNALPIIPTPLNGNVILGPPNVNKEIVADVDFGFTFDPTLVSENERRSLAFDITVVFGPDTIDPGEGFQISELESGSSVIFRAVDLEADLVTVSHLGSVTPGDLNFGLPDGMFSYLLTPLSDYNRLIPGPAVDVVSFSVALVTRAQLPPPEVPPPPTQLAEPASRLGPVDIHLVGLCRVVGSS